MLPGFLTTALELLIILDVCGAIIYFALTGFARIKKPSAQPPQNTHAPIQSFGIDTPVLAPAQPYAPHRPIAPAVYLHGEPEPQSDRRWLASFKHRVTSLKQAFTYRPATQGAVKTQAADPDYARLGRVLDSFKEET